VAEAVVRELGEEWKDKKVLFARAAEGRDVIPVGLRDAGAEVDEVAVYRNVRPESSAGEFREALGEGKADAITFTSASTVKNFAGLFPEGDAAGLLEGVAVACIGPVTAAAAEELGIAPDVMPKDYTIPALTRALEEFFNTGG
jgi:uroporphyrinogen III methyltransferase/synthase